MNFYLMILLGIVLMAYGLYISVRKNVMVLKPYETVLIGCITLISTYAIESFRYMIVGLLILSLILYRRNYTLYNTDLWRVKEAIREILEKHNIMHSVEENRIVLSENQGVIKFSYFAKVVHVNFNNAAMFNREMIKELKNSQFNDETATSYNGLILILLGILYSGTVFIMYL